MTLTPNEFVEHASQKYEVFQSLQADYFLITVIVQEANDNGQNVSSL